MKQEDLQLKQEMFQIVERWEQSGISIRAFSNSEGISYEKLRYWKKKFKGSNQNIGQKLFRPQKNFSDFISVEVPKNTVNFSGLELTYPNQVKITCPSGIELDTLKSLIKIF